MHLPWPRRKTPHPVSELHCPNCGDRARPGALMLVRAGAHPDELRTLGWCRSCRRVRWLQPVPSGPVAAARDRDLTWREVAAYVAQGALEADAAERIINAEAPEHRKREIAAYVAEGMIESEAAVRLLRAARVCV